MDEAKYQKGVEIAKAIFEQHFQHGKTGVEVTLNEYKKIRERAYFEDDHAFLFSALIDEAIGHGDDRGDRDTWELLIKIARERLINGEPIAPVLDRWGLEVATGLLKKPPQRNKAMIRNRATIHAMAVLTQEYKFKASRNKEPKNREPKNRKTKPHHSAADAVSEAAGKYIDGYLHWSNVARIWDKRNDPDQWEYTDYRYINPNHFGAPRPT